MDNLILLRYSVDSKIIDKFIRDFQGDLNVLVVNNYPDSDFSSTFADINIVGDNRLREFSGIFEALNYVKISKNNKLFICNDTILINRCSWKLNFLINKLKEVNINYPTIFGFPDRSFEFLSDHWFLRNGFHIRTDIFALNSNGTDFFKDIMKNDFDKMILRDQVFKEVSLDFMKRHQKYKIGQRKEVATYIELFISCEFYKNGFIYDARDINFKVRNSFDKIIKKIFKK